MHPSNEPISTWRYDGVKCQSESKQSHVSLSRGRKRQARYSIQYLSWREIFCDEYLDIWEVAVER